MPKGILERLADGVVLGDGGYLLELEKRGYVRPGPFTPEAVLTHPHALIELHREFMHAGAEVLQALTFYASEDKLATVGLAGKVDEINRQAMGINYIGSCCGSVAEHVREMARVLGKLPEDDRPWRLNYGKPMSAYEIHKHGIGGSA